MLNLLPASSFAVATAYACKLSLQWRASVPHSSLSLSLLLSLSLSLFSFFPHFCATLLYLHLVYCGCHMNWLAFCAYEIKWNLLFFVKILSLQLTSMWLCDWVGVWVWARSSIVLVVLLSFQSILLCPLKAQYANVALSVIRTTSAMVTNRKYISKINVITAFCWIF